MPVHVADRLAQAVRTKKNPVCVGLDPRADLLPPGMLDADRSCATVATAYRQWGLAVLDVVAPLVPVVKPQAAFFEQLGPPGMEALHALVQDARRRGLFVILDGKRNDIGSTAEAYADAYLGDATNSAWGADALTVSPYLGDDSLRPFVQVAAQRGCGVFVLVKTSNPGGGQFQDLVCEGRPLYRHVADYVESLAKETISASGYGAVGAVVGATYPAQQAELRAAMPTTWFLVPGFGSQGATAQDVAGAFAADGLGAIVNNSRGLLFAYRQKPYAEKYGAARWQAALESATQDMIAQLRADTPASKL